MLRCHVKYWLFPRLGANLLSVYLRYYGYTNRKDTSPQKTTNLSAWEYSASISSLRCLISNKWKVFYRAAHNGSPFMPQCCDCIDQRRENVFSPLSLLSRSAEWWGLHRPGLFCTIQRSGGWLYYSHGTSLGKVCVSTRQNTPVTKTNKYRSINELLLHIHECTRCSQKMLDTSVLSYFVNLLICICVSLVARLFLKFPCSPDHSRSCTFIILNITSTCY